VALASGSKFGPYDVITLVGAGGMGEVYRARDSRLNRDVALKVLLGSVAQDPARLSRFTREAQVLAALNHPQIGAIHGVEESDGVTALVLEYVEGQTLADRIARGPLPVNEAVPVALQIAQALEAAHEQGVIHRDLKPANIKLRPDGTVKVLDFGLAKTLESPVSGSAERLNSPTFTQQGTAVGMILGTAAYMAPEQARGSSVDKRADIWAFGVVLYEMLTGRRPFDGATVTDTLAAVLTSEPDWGRVPLELRPLVRRCLTKDVRQRLRDIGDARIALTEPSSPALATGPRETNLLFAWAIAAVLAGALVTSLWRGDRSQSAAAPLMRFNLPFDGGGPLALSSDGTRVAYVGEGPDHRSRILIRRLDQQQAVPVAGTEGAQLPFFSPDGQSLAFFADSKLKRVAIAGGSPIVVCDAPDPRGGSWSDDGTIVFAPTTVSSLVRVPAAGGVPTSLTALDSSRHEVTHRWPQVVGGGKGVLFTANTNLGSYENASIEVQSLRTRERKALVRHGYYGRYATSGHLLFIHHGVFTAVPLDLDRLTIIGPAISVLENVSAAPGVGFADVATAENGMLVYVEAQNLQFTVAWWDAAGRVTPLRLGEGNQWDPRLSPDGRRLAFVTGRSGDDELWVAELDRGTTTRLTFSAGSDVFPEWAPDGMHLVFSSERHGGPANLYWIRADGGGEAIRLTHSATAQHATSFAPDGKHLLFSEEAPPNQSNVLTLALDQIASDHPTISAPEAVVATPFNEMEAVFSPDARWVAYVSDESGQNEVYVRPFQHGSGKWTVSAGGGVHPAWSRRTSELFYLNSEGLMVANYTATGSTFVAQRPRIWAKIGSLVDYDLASDGRRVVVARHESERPNSPPQLTFLLNFFGELRRRAPAAP
jgi:Tol biopolymer transport system component